jgi:hypothetical protein
MKTTQPISILLVCLLGFLFGPAHANGDTLVTFNGRTISGTIIQTNEDEVLLLTDYAAYNFSRANIKQVKTEPTRADEFNNTNRFPDFKHLVLFLSRQPWATNLSPIPATVIDKGILRNVPYTSFRCGEDYEVNVYGDLEHPAGMEIGVYRKLLDNVSAKDNCVKFISNLLGQSADKETVQRLDLKKDLKTRNGLTFEITPPTDEDAYNGWWVSVYSEQKLNQARASDAELKQISVTKADATTQAGQSENSWSADELKKARHSTPTMITFTYKSGTVVSNAEVVHVNDGISLIWRKDNGASGGLVKLAELPEELQVQFGYDPAKTEAADALEAQKKAQWQQAQALGAQSAQTVQESQAAPAPDYNNSGYSSGGDRVYVHGYYRANGTYVNAYTRSYPHSR